MLNHQLNNNINIIIVIVEVLLDLVENCKNLDEWEWKCRTFYLLSEVEEGVERIIWNEAVTSHMNKIQYAIFLTPKL